MGKRKITVSGSRAVFLDRDGVINRVMIREGKAFSPRSRAEFAIFDEAPEAIARLRNAGLLVVVVTNQPDIARGMLTLADLDWMTSEIRNRCRVDEVIVCPHDDHDDCSCRKPKAGMLIESGRKWRIDLSGSFMIGDSWKDMEAGRRAGCVCLLVDTSYNKDLHCSLRVENLTAAVEFILRSTPESTKTHNLT